MKDGRIQYQGTLSEVKKQEPELYESWRLALREAKASESRSELLPITNDKTQYRCSYSQMVL